MSEIRVGTHDCVSASELRYDPTSPQLSFSVAAPMHIVCGRVRLSLLALLLVCVMDAEAGFTPKSEVTGADGNAAVEGGGAFGECEQAPELNGEDAVAEEGSEGGEEWAGEEDLGSDCSGEEPIDPNADYN